MRKPAFAAVFCAVVGAVSWGGPVLAQNNGASIYDGGVTPTRSVWSGVFTQAQAERGQKSYLKFQCNYCHREDLEGDASNGVSSLLSFHFMVNWDGQSVADLERRIHTSPNDDPSDMDIVTGTDLVAFILAANHVPPGNTELPADRDIQAQILITTNPPDGIQRVNNSNTN